MNQANIQLSFTSFSLIEPRQIKMIMNEKYINDLRIIYDDMKEVESSITGAVVIDNEDKLIEKYHKLENFFMQNLVNKYFDKFDMYKSKIYNSAVKRRNEMLDYYINQVEDQIDEEMFLLNTSEESEKEHIYTRINNLKSDKKYLLDLQRRDYN